VGCVWPLTSDQFFSNFWPNLFATLSGVGIGVPLALWINRVTRKHEGRAEREANNERLSHALDVLAIALKDNLAMLKGARDGVAKGYVTGLPLNASAWEAARGDITPLLRDTKLKVLLAHHFEQLALFATHVERHAEYFIGMPATLDGAQRIREALGGQLVPFADRLIGEVEQLLKEFGETKARLSSGNRALTRLTP
jgi:hypothetical protein